MKKPSRKFWYFIGIGVLILFSLILVSSVLDIGERLEKIHLYVAYAFYGLVVLLCYLLLVRPIMIIVFSPSFSVETILDKKSRKNYKIYKKVSKRLIKQENLSTEAKEKLKNAGKDYDQLKEALSHIYNHYIKKEINKVVKKHAKTVMISTAISQNARVDFFTVFVCNVRMIKEIVVICGFRPSFKNLAKLTLNVFTTALIAEGLERISITDVLPNNTINALGDIPFIKPLLSSATQGVSNCLLTLRIGIVTRKFLFSDAKEMTKEEIRRGALIEASKLLPVVIGEAFVSVPKNMYDKMKDKFKKDKNTSEEI